MGRLAGNINAPTVSYRMRRVGAVIDALCWVMLILIVATVVVGLIQRARFERSYAIAVVVAIAGALVMFIGLAQQAIAARDLATWREMATWQLRAGRQRGQPEVDGDSDIDGPGGGDPYQAVALDVLIEDILDRTDGDKGHA